MQLHQDAHALKSIIRKFLTDIKLDGAAKFEVFALTIDEIQGQIFQIESEYQGSDLQSQIKSQAREFDAKSKEIEALHENLNTQSKDIETLKNNLSNCKLSLQAAKDQILHMVPEQELRYAMSEAASIKMELGLSCEAQSRLSSRAADLEVECRLLRKENEGLMAQIKVSPTYALLSLPLITTYKELEQDCIPLATFVDARFEPFFQDPKNLSVDGRNEVQ
jgi:hypothetical protein